MSLTLYQALHMLAEPKWLVLHGVEWTSHMDRAQKAKANFIWKIKARTRTVASMPRGLWFRIETWVDYPSKAVLQLECDFPNTRSHIVLYRLEMEPFGTHLNSGWGPPELTGQFFDVGVTHEHSFLHYARMADAPLSPGGDPMAAITLNPPADFDSAVVHACGILNIQNPDEIPPVPMQRQLV